MSLTQLDKKIFLKVYYFTNNKEHIKLFAKYFSIVCKILFKISYFSLVVYLFLNNTLETKVVVIPFFVYALLKLIRFLIKRKRPFLIFPNLNLPKKNKYSFPSNHTGTSFIISYTFLYLNFYVGIIFFIASTVLGICRVIIGVHFPLDVFCGFLISSIVSMLFYLI